ncbi:hypothetical protein LSUE1_G002460 [Lachnellula suecica]|uniref:AB hydrolase-1 domain-containing protein n=1 Tax=Lachnellula suecica TaxID=602035 RepID=A0A8T9CCE7_9HELO|nr:hypothetical protein LSUE1_G002460 [Lachnellula suecica]
MAAENPTLILVHGAFHKPSTFHLLTPKLEALSYPVVAPQLACSKGTSPTVMLADDVAIIKEVMVPLMDAGKEIVLVAHSYGGTPGCAAVEGQTVAERSVRGEKGGVKAMLFISCLMVPKRGMTSSGALGVGPEGPPDMPFMDVKGAYGVLNEKAKDVFYNDVQEDVANEMMKETTMTQQAFGCFNSPVNFVASDLTIPATYLFCENDNCVPIAVQERQAASAPNLILERCSAGHSPMLSHPDRLVEIIVKVAQG